MNNELEGKEFQFVDAHVHFYDMKHPRLQYDHWQPDRDHPFLGAQTRKLGGRNYTAFDFHEEAFPVGTVKAVHVQAAIGSKDPVVETEWLSRFRGKIGIPNAIVGHVDLRSDDAERQIQRHMLNPDFKGIRDFSYGDYLLSSEFRSGFALLEKYNLVSSIAAQWQDMEKLRDLATTYPNILIVLDHAGFPIERNSSYFSNWKNGMASISRLENVICKISGLGMGDNRWTVESIRPYVETCIELFGCEKALFASNWPIDSLWSSYDTLISAYRSITQHYSVEEKELLFSRNTETIYGI